MSKKIAIIGATSGIGRALARELHSRGHHIGATGRRIERLEELKQELERHISVTYMDVTNHENAINQLEQLKQKMGGIDTIVLNAGISNYQKAVGREGDLQIIDVNIRGFANLTAYSFSMFYKQGHGHIVGISSVASLFGWGLSAPYSASKAFVNTYLQGYRQKANHSDADIAVSTILPGFVKSEMTDGKKGMFWIAETEEAATQIADAIRRKKNWSYVPKRWRLVSWLIKLIPNWVWDRL
ncbi:Short-chain dehydrogenase [Fodinibius salinus]|uniref:Short-chain dehydrogenase n=1 Tax=Fodinibius salinus TaxID=860790 RepID=A0A5D3YKK7_9BACT|nr:SDR family NAD(P)-dependent oxidoreductase [Fodinibius salinus]TYP94048.1 Short-chain dehydrogenase [Fodinibius salinus]